MMQESESQRILWLITREMIACNAGDTKRIFHFLKVHALAKQIALTETADPEVRFTVEVAALTHDIGIKASEEKYQSASGHYQQTEGPPLAKKLLKEIGVSDHIIDRVCYLIGHHHDYAHIEGLDYRILIESDFLVNMQEDGWAADKIVSAAEKYFKTSAGKQLCEMLFGCRLSL